MWSAKRIAGFFGRLVLIYALFVAVWPVIRGGYAAFFSAGGNALFRSLIPGGSVRFEQVKTPEGPLDTRIHCMNLGTGHYTRMSTPSRGPAYMPTAFVASLVLATPFPWRRRLWALLWALVLIHVFIACQLLIVILDAFCGAHVSLFVPSPPWDSVLGTVHKIAARGMVTHLMIAVLIWGLVSLCQADRGERAQTGARLLVGRDPHVRAGPSRQGSSRIRKPRRPR